MKEEGWPDRCERYFTSIAENERRSHLSKAPTGVPVSPARHEKTPSAGNTWSLKSWLSSMDLHGTSFLAGSKSTPARVLWLLLCATGITALSYLVAIRIGYFMSASSHFTLQTAVNAPTSLPLSVVVCNFNILRKSSLQGSRYQSLADLDHVDNVSLPFRDLRPGKVNDVFQNSALERWNIAYSIQERLIQTFRQEYEQYEGMLSATDWLVLYQNALEGDVTSIKRALRPTRQELRRHGVELHNDMLHCWKGGRRCRYEELNYYPDRLHGNCLEINMTNAERLSLIFHTHPEEYLGLMTSQHGFLVRVFPGIGQTDSVDEFIVSPGNKLHLGVQKVSEYVRQQPCDVRQEYSFQHCIGQCLEARTREVCGCSLSVDASPSTRCRVDQEYQYVCQRVMEWMLSSRTLPCSCRRRCREHRLDVESSSSPWPATQHFDHLLRSLQSKGYKGLAADIRTELMHVELNNVPVFFDKFVEEHDISVIGFLVELGALTALMCGLSLITCFEIFAGLAYFGYLGFKTILCSDSSQEKALGNKMDESLTITWSHKDTNETTDKNMQSLPTVLSTLTPLGQSSLDPIREVDTPRSDDHTYEPIYSKISPRENFKTRPGVPIETNLDTNWTSYGGRKQWNSLDRSAFGRNKGRQPSFGSLGKSGFENKVFYGSKDDVNRPNPKPAAVTQANALPRRNSWSERTNIPPFDMVKMNNADGF